MRPLLVLLPLLLEAACNTSGGAGIPSGMIALFDGDCPSGWSRYTPLDGKFPRGAAEAGAEGGSEKHTHYTEFTARTSRDGEHQHNLAGGEPVEVDRGVFGDVGLLGNALKTFEEGGHDRTKAVRAQAYTEAVPGHDHFLSVRAESEESESLPPYRELVFCRKD